MVLDPLTYWRVSEDRSGHAQNQMLLYGPEANDFRPCVSMPFNEQILKSYEAACIGNMYFYIHCFL